jgi:hypothetical protein
MFVLLLIVGCKDETAPGAAEVQPTPTKEVAPSGPLQNLAAPEGVLVFGGADNLTALTTKLAAMAGPAGQGMSSKAIAQGLSARYKLKDPGVLLFDKPARVAVIDPKTYKEAGVLMVSTTGKDKLIAALPDKKDNDQGNAISFTSAGARATYLNFLDDYAVFTNDAAIFGKNKAFLVKLAGAKLGNDVMVVVSAKNAAKIYKTEIAAAAADAKKNLGGAGMPMGGAGLTKMIEWFTSVTNDLDKVVITAAPISDGATMNIDVYPKKETPLDKSFKLLGERKLALLEKMPANAPAVFAMSVDPDNADELTRSLTAWSLQLSMGEELDPKYADATNDYWKATTGDVAFVAHMVPGAEGLRFSALTGIRNAELARKSQATLRGMYKEEKLKKMYDDMGMKLDFKLDAYKVGDVPVSIVKAELTEAKAGSNVNLKAALGGTSDLLSNMMNSHIAIGEAMSFMVYGTDAKPTVQAWLGGKVAGGFDKSPALARVMKNAAKGMFMLAYGSPTELMRAFNPKIPSFGPKGNGGGIALTAGATDGVVHIVLDLPSDQASAVMTGMMMLR